MGTKIKFIKNGGSIMKMNSKYINGFIEKIIHPDINGKEYRCKSTDKARFTLQYILDELNLIENISTSKDLKYITSLRLAEEINKYSGSKNKKYTNYVDGKYVNTFIKNMIELGFFNKIVNYTSTIRVEGKATRVYTYNILLTPAFYDYIIESGLVKKLKGVTLPDYKNEYKKIVDELENKTTKEFTEVEKDKEVVATADKVTKTSRTGKNKSKTTTEYKDVKVKSYQDKCKEGLELLKELDEDDDGMSAQEWADTWNLPG